MNFSFTLFLASQDAIEVMFVMDSLTHWLIVCTDLTDVTLVSEDTYAYGDDKEDEEDDEDEEGEESKECEEGEEYEEGEEVE